MMRKVSMIVALAIGLVLSSPSLLAQAPNNATNTGTTAGPTGTNGTTLATIDTFSAYGSIASLIFDITPTTATVGGNATNISAPSGNNTLASVLPGKTFILTGFWRLKVDDGNVTSFAAKFTKVHLDGTNRHTHQLTNFHATNNPPVRLNANDTTIISGTTDVALNGTNAWINVKTTVLIDKLSTITISLDPKDTANHFKGQSIYGTVNLLIDKDGKRLIIFPHV